MDYIIIYTTFIIYGGQVALVNVFYYICIYVYITRGYWCILLYFIIYIYMYVYYIYWVYCFAHTLLRVIQN